MVMAASAMAGCLGDVQEAPGGVLALPGAEDPGFTFTSENCYEAGFQAVYSGQRTFAGTWNSANAKEEYGNPVLDSSNAQLPLLPLSYANVHNGFRCATTTYGGQVVPDFQFGFVGDPIVPPAWDTGGADLHFLVSFIGLQKDGLVYPAMDQRTTARISQVLDSSFELLEGDLTAETFRMHQEFALADNGVYEGTGDMTKYRDVAPRTIRLWWTVPSDGSESTIGAHEGHDENPEVDNLDWNPIYWDIQTPGGPQWTTPQLMADTQGCHGGTDDHGDIEKLCQPTQNAIYEHPSLTFTMGPVFKDVVIEDYWFH